MLLSSTPRSAVIKPDSITIIDPNTSNTTINDFYLDDLISVTNIIEEAIQMQPKVSSTLIKHRFPLRNWVSTSTEVLNIIKSAPHQDTLMNYNKDKTSGKKLGLY